MLTIYNIPHSLYGAKLRVALRFKGLDWEDVPPPGGYGSAEYKAMVPGGNLPALRDGDLLLADGEAIVEYLEERYPEPPLLPGNADERAKIRERSRFHDTRLEPALRGLFPYMPGRVEPPAGFIAKQSAEISTRLAQLGQLLGSTPLAGQTLTLGDCGFPMTFIWIDALTPRMGLQIAWPERVLAYQQQVEAQPSMSAELSDYRPLVETFFGT
jgi:glutathione S-transferase/maleylpyruvate isomerase